MGDPLSRLAAVPGGLLPATLVRHARRRHGLQVIGIGQRC